MAEHKKAHRADDKRGPGKGDNVVHVARVGSTGSAKSSLSTEFHTATGQNGTGKRAK
jgi:hypothetical protein